MPNEPEVSFVIKVKDAASAALHDIEKAAEKVGEQLLGFKDILGGITAAAAGFSLVEVTKSIVELGVASDKTFREIAANLPTFTEGIGNLKEEIEALANASGRGLEAMEQSAAAIAKLGASSAEDLAQQLKAATMLADATGTSVDESAQLLTQLRREFHLTGEEALDTAAKIASISQGKIGITELQAAFTASAPTFVKFGIDVDTGVRAISSLIEAGLTTSRAIRGELGKLDGEGIKQLAAQSTIASDALETLAKRAGEVREGSARAAEVVKNELTSALEDLGVRILPTVSTYLKGITELLDLIKAGNWKAVLAGIVGNDAGLDAAANPSTGVLSSRFTSIKAAGPAAKQIILPQTQAEKKAAEEAALAQMKLALALDETARKEAVATQKAMELARAQGETLSAAIEQSLGVATGHLAQAAAEAIDDRAKKLVREIVLNDELTMATKERLLAEVELTRQIEQAQNAATPVLNRGTLSLASIGGPGHTANSDLTALMAQEQALLEVDKNIVAVGGDDQKVKAQLLEIEKKRAEIQKGMTADAAAASVTDTQQQEKDRQHILALAQGWATVGRSIIAAGQALGDMNATTAAMLQNVVSLGEGIVNLFSGNVAQGLAETATSLASLVAGLFKHGDDAQSQALIQQHITAMKSLTDALNEIAKKGAAGLVGNVDLNQAIAAKGYAQGILGGKSPGIVEAYTIAEVAKALGVTIDGTVESYREFITILEAGIPALQQAADDAQAAHDAQMKQDQEDYHVRLLRAEGYNTEADAEEFAEKQKREYQAAVDSGADADTLAALKATQAAEATKFFGDAAAGVATALVSAAQKFSQAMSILSDNEDVHGITDPLAILGDTSKAAGIDLSGYDLSTQAGRDAANAFLLGVWDYQDLDPSLRPGLKATIDALHRLPAIAGTGGATGTIGAGAFGSPGLASIANSFAGLTAIQGDRLSDIQLRQLGVLTDIRGLMAMQLRVPGFAGVNLGAATRSFAASAGSGGAVSIGPITIQVATLSDDPKIIGRQIGDEILREIDKGLGRKLNVQKTYDGSISVTPV